MPKETKSLGQPITIDPTQLGTIAEKVFELINAKPTEPTKTSEVTSSGAGQVGYVDPYLQVLEERKIEIIKGGLNCVLVKGRRGVNEINRTQQELNMINDEINNKKNWNTHKRVG